MDQHLFVERSLRKWYVFNRDLVLETDQTGQDTGVKSDAVFLDYELSLSVGNVSQLCGVW